MAQPMPYSDTPMSAKYDQYSSTQLEANLRNLPALISALTVTDSHGQVLHIGDFGSATGLNSMKIFSQAFRSFRETSDTQISVHHVDIPSNDWGILFNNAINSPDSYLTIKGTFVEAVGRSNYVRVFPDNFLSIVYSNSSLHWLSRPLDSPNQLQRILEKSAEIEEELNRHAEEELDLFLLYRASELKVGGRLILQCPTNASSFLSTFCLALRSMSEDGLISSNLLQNVKQGFCSRSSEDFQRAVSKLSTRLRILFIQTNNEPLVYYKKYLENQNKEEYVENMKNMARAVSENIARKVLEVSDRTHPLLDELYKRYGDFLGADTQPIITERIQVVIEKIA